MFGNQSYNEIFTEITKSKATRNPLRDALRTFDDRDILDAVRDAEVLLSALKLKYKEETGRDY